MDDVNTHCIIKVAMDAKFRLLKKIEFLVLRCSSWPSMMWGEFLKVLAGINFHVNFWLNVAHLVTFGPIWEFLPQW